MAQQDVLFDTTFPTAHDKDLAMNIRVLREKYERFYPIIGYRQLNLGVPDPQEGDVPDVVPPPEITEIDDLWGEPVATGQLPGLDWMQPHTTDLEATEGDKRLPAINIHAHVNHEPGEKALSRYAIDEKRVVITTLFVPILQDHSITVRHGDRYFWKNHVLEVLKWTRRGYWKDTSYHLYIETVAKYARYGS